MASAGRLAAVRPSLAGARGCAAGEERSFRRNDHARVPGPTCVARRRRRLVRVASSGGDGDVVDGSGEDTAGTLDGSMGDGRELRHPFEDSGEPRAASALLPGGDFGAAAADASEGVALRKKTNVHRRMKKLTNPMALHHRTAASSPVWSDVYDDLDRPLLIDVGCAKGRFLMRAATTDAERFEASLSTFGETRPKRHNLLGLEIYAPIVEEALRWTATNALRHRRDDASDRDDDRDRDRDRGFLKLYLSGVDFLSISRVSGALSPSPFPESPFAESPFVADFG
mmetsp:Transcript_12764/g.53505  ORF Transcript_12764/g.53505 Transcript_12764/m.53505 type:complete len:284 (-) Transcript_12764:1146-1997(-)